MFLFLGELHLTPICGALQLRPSFEYLNKGESNVRQNTSVTEEGMLTRLDVSRCFHDDSYHVETGITL